MQTLSRYLLFCRVTADGRAATRKGIINAVKGLNRDMRSGHLPSYMRALCNVSEADAQRDCMPEERRTNGVVHQQSADEISMTSPEAGQKVLP